MLSLIQGEVVTAHGWLTSQQFTDIVAVSQMTPGPIGINSATYVGFTATGSVWGSVVATFAVCLPSFILMLTISKFFLKYQHHPLVESVFKGLRPAVIGLLAAAALLLMNVENFGDPVTDKYKIYLKSLEGGVIHRAKHFPRKFSYTIIYFVSKSEHKEKGPAQTDRSLSICECNIYSSTAACVVTS